MRPRYYQEQAIYRVIERVIRGQKRVLLTMATGTGKTSVAFQIAWKVEEVRRGKASLEEVFLTLMEEER